MASRTRRQLARVRPAEAVEEDFAGEPAPRQLAPTPGFGRDVAMFNFDVSFDGKRALFCMKPEDEKAYHLYEIGLDGSDFRQITFGGYSDIDPVYLPGDRYLFLSTRAEVYAQCRMWARCYWKPTRTNVGWFIWGLSPHTADAVAAVVFWHRPCKSRRRNVSIIWC